MSWAYVAVAAAAVVSAIGTAVSADAQRRAANTNADIQMEAAKAARQKAGYDEQRHRESIQKLLSAQRALYGKSGLEMSGSPLLVMEDTAGEGELDALAIRYGGDVAAARARSGANLSRMQARDVQTAGYFQAGSTLLSGAGSAFGSKAKVKPSNLITDSGDQSFDYRKALK
jgi:septal ring-binding cell division protein DamX